MSETKFSTFGNRLKTLREQAGIKQGQFADRISISRQSMSNYESGKHSPDIDVIIRMADFFKCSTDYLLGLTEHPSHEVQKGYDDDISHLSQRVLALPWPFREPLLDSFTATAECVQRGVDRGVKVDFQLNVFSVLLVKLMELCYSVMDKQRAGDYTVADAKAANDKLRGLLRMLQAEMNGLDDSCYQCLNPPTDSYNTITQK